MYIKNMSNIYWNYHLLLTFSTFIWQFHYLKILYFNWPQKVLYSENFEVQNILNLIFIHIHSITSQRYGLLISLNGTEQEALF